MSGRDWYGNDIAVGDVVVHRDPLIAAKLGEAVVESVDRDTCRIRVGEVEENSGMFILVEKRG